MGRYDPGLFEVAMNINRARVFLVFVNVGLAGLTGFTAYKEFKAKDQRSIATAQFEEKLNSELGKIVRVSGRTGLRSNVDQKDLVDMTGQPKAEPVPESTKTVETKATTYSPLEPLIRVLTITCSDNPVESRVGIVRKAAGETGAEAIIFGVGDIVPFANNAQIVAIHTKDVVFQNGEQQETLPINEQPVADGGAGAARQPGTDSRAGAVGNIADYLDVKPDSGIVKVRSGGARAIARDGEQVLEGVIFSTTDIGGGKKALKVDKIPAGSPLSKFGAVDGDVLISVDDIPMSTKAEVVDYAKKNPSKSRFDVKIQRKGGILTKQVLIER